MTSVTAKNDFEVGASPKLRAKLYDSDGDLFDPSDLSLIIHPPSGSNVSKTLGDITKESTGIYYYAYTITLEGHHEYRFTGTDASGRTEVRTGSFEARSTF